MPMTRSAFVLRAVRKARAGAGPDESKIYEDNADLLVPNALNRLAMDVMRDPERRDYLRQSYSLTATAGLVDISATGILREGLQHALFYDPDDTDQKCPYIFKRHPGELDRWQNPEFGYFAQKNGFLVTRQRGNGDVGSSKTSMTGMVTLSTVYVPDLLTTFVPAPLEDDAVDLLVRVILENRTA
jgi:hypothetical protein